MAAKKSSSLKAPYEAVLTETIKKLTSQIFLFLLGYLMLLIGLGYFTPDLATNLKLLLYIIPIAGLAAYVYLQGRELAKKPPDPPRDEVVVESDTAIDSEITGERGPSSEGDGSVYVGSGLAIGSNITGRDRGGPKQANDEGFLLDLFRRLDDEGRLEVINAANALLKRPRRTNKK